MGKLTSGPNGPVIGSVGNNTSYMLNGQNVIRIKARRKKRKVKSLSIKQQANCMQLSVLNDFFKHLTPLLKVGFSLEAMGTTKNFHNVATAHNKPNALMGEFPNIEMDYPKVLISSGNLPLPQTTSVSLEDNQVIFSWSADEHLPDTSPEDQAMILIFFPEVNDPIFFCYSSMRSEGQKVVPLPDHLKVLRMETYISFIADDRTEVGTSRYLGRLN